MKDVKGKLKAIQQHRDRLDKELEEKLNAEEKERRELVSKLAKLAPRIKDLMTIGTALLNAGIPLGTRTSSPDDSYELVSNCWSHRIGYIIGYPNILKGVGKMGGGACGRHFALDEHGKISDLGYVTNSCEFITDEHDKDFIGKARAFIYGFDEFEKKVSEYIDGLNK